MSAAPQPLVLALDALTNGTIEWTRWRGTDDGGDRIDICRLYGHEQEGPSAALLRYSPNASVPPHEHSGYEHIFVLQGFQQDESGVYPAGTMVVNAPGSRHSVCAPEGCIVLAVWERPVVFLGQNEYQS